MKKTPAEEEASVFQDLKNAVGLVDLVINPKFRRKRNPVTYALCAYTATGRHVYLLGNDDPEILCMLLTQVLKQNAAQPAVAIERHQ